MINLIPTEKKKKILMYFYYRLFVVFVFVLSFLVLILSFLILPSYFISSSNKNIINQKIESQKSEIIPKLDEQTLSVLNNLNSKLTLIEKYKEEKYLVSQKVLLEIVSRKIPGIKINHIFYENNLKEGRRININGTASSREQLLMFRQSFEGTSAFKEVDLPISNFVKGSNLQFNLNLIPS